MRRVVDAGGSGKAPRLPAPLSAETGLLQLVESALVHAARRRFGKPTLILNRMPVDATLIALLNDPRIGGIGIPGAAERLPKEYRGLPKLGRIHANGEWTLPAAAAAVYFCGSVRQLSRPMIASAWRNGASDLYARAGSLWLRMPLARLYRGLALARRIRRKLAAGRLAVADRLKQARRSLTPASRPVALEPPLNPTRLEEAVFRAFFTDASASRRVAGRVVVVCGNLAPGGAERQAANTVIGLSKAGITDVLLLAHYLDPGPQRLDFHLSRIRAAGVSAREINRATGNRRDAELPRAFGRSAKRLPANLVIDIADLVREFVSLRPEIVHAWLDWDNIRAGVAAAIAGVPRILLSGRNLAPYHFALYQPFMRPIYRALARLPQVQFLNNSRAGGDSYADWIGIPRQGIRVIHNGFDSGNNELMSRPERDRGRRDMGLDQDALLVGGVFRFDEEKRPLLWLEAAARIAAGNKVHFVLYGQGQMRAAMDARIAKLGLEGKVTIFGVTDDPLRAMSLMDVMLLTSFGEGLPNVLIEAQSVGTAVVSTNAGGASEAVNIGISGIIVDSSDPAVLATAVISLLRDPAALARARKEGPGFVRARFGMDRMISETLDAYGLRAIPAPPSHH